MERLPPANAATASAHTSASIFGREITPNGSSGSTETSSSPGADLLFLFARDQFGQSQGTPPVEKLAQEDHEPSGSVCRPMRLNFTFLKQGQLLPEKQILGRQGATGLCRLQQKPSKVHRQLAKTLEQVNEARTPTR
jgi:hypothetical protein